ncbi:MAG: malate synthase A, partial [Leifsonia sp.]
MNTTPTMTLERETARSEPATPTGSFATTQPWIEVTAPLGDRYAEIITPEALEFLAELHDRFAGT